MNNENAAKLRPFDATKCKPGDPVVSADGEQGRFVAYVPDARPDSTALVKWAAAPASITYTSDGRFAVGSSVTVFLPPLDPLDEVDPSPGNVDKMTRRQVGEGFRIPSPDEPRDDRAEYWDRGDKKWTQCAKGPWLNYGTGNTYRVPIAPAMVPLEQSDIILGKTVVRDYECRRLVIAADHSYVNIPDMGYVSYANLVRYDISFDHGVTWQKAEKKGGVK